MKLSHQASTSHMWHAGTAKVTKCNLHGEAYTLSGCSLVPLCVAPSDVTGYEVTETSLDRDSFNVKVKCAWGRVSVEDE